MPDPISNRDLLTDHVATWMAFNCPSFSIDRILSDPVLALRMGIEIANDAGLLDDRAAAAAARRAGAFSLSAQKAVHEVCRAALSARKRGDLRRDVP